MALIDVTKVQEEARKELCEEATKVAKEKLKDLYTKQGKARLVVTNIQREIDSYLSEIAELATYAAAGVDTSK